MRTYRREKEKEDEREKGREGREREKEGREREGMERREGRKSLIFLSVWEGFHPPRQFHPQEIN